MMGLNFLNTYFKCTNFKTKIGHNIKCDKTGTIFKLDDIIGNRFWGCESKLGMLSRVLLMTLIVFVCLLDTEIYAINLLEPQFDDSFVSVIDTPSAVNYGNISVNGNDDLYVTGGGSSEVYLIQGGISAPIASGVTLAVGVLADGDLLYFGDHNVGIDFTENIYMFNLRTKTFEKPPLDVAPNGANDIIKAPKNWGPFGGQLVIAGPESIYALDPISGIITNIADAGPNSIFNNLAFTNDNQLIATTYTGKTLVQVDPDGTIETLINFADRTESVVVHQPSGDAFVVTNNGITREGNLYRVNLNALQSTLFANDFTVNIMFFPHPLAFSNDFGTLFYGDVEEVDQLGFKYVIRQITGFKTDVINDLVSFEPDPSTYKFTRIKCGCPADYVGKFKFDARLTNISDSMLTDLAIDIDQLTRGNRVLPYPIEDMNLWNKLGSIKQIRNSKIGPDGTVDGGRFVSGVHGRAYSARYNQDELVRFPNAVMPIEAGTIEFWAKLKNVPYEIDWGHNPHFVSLNDDVGHSAYFIGFNGNDGAGNGGLVGCVGGGGSDSYYYGGITTGTGTYAQQWNYEDILGAGKVEDWHHYALVWDKNGIVGVDNGQRVVAVYLNGKPVSKQWGRFPGSELIPIESGELSMVRNWLSQGKVAMDNIKVWSFAKTDFSDRFTEGGSLGEGESFKIKNIEDYTDGVLSPGESVEVPFTVCLTDTEPFQFYVDVLGVTLNLNEGLVAYYPFSGNADDESGNGHHGTVYGAALTEDIFREPNSAYSFDGTSDYISIPVDINPELMPQLTMTAWARADNDPPKSWPVMQVISHDNGGYDRSFGIDFRGGGAGWSAFSGSGGVLGYHPVEIGKWVFLAVVYDQDAETVTLHVNGSKYKEKGRLGSGYNYCFIGDNPIPHMSEYFAGVIDELRIYNRALSEDEIEVLYHFGE